MALVPTALFVVLAVALTWPLAADPWARLVGNRPLDISVGTWNLWWFHHALTVLHANPLTTNAIFYPAGVGLILHSYSPLGGLMALPLLGWLGPVAAYNVVAILALALAGAGVYYLGRTWLGPLGATVAGVLFAASPWLLHQLRVGHLNLVNAGLLPLAVLAIARSVTAPGWRWPLLAVLTVVGTALADWFLVVALMLPAAGVAVWGLWSTAGWPARRRALGRLAAVAAVCAACLAPFVLAGLEQASAVPARDLAKYQAEQQEYSADLAAYVLPQLLHPVWGRTVNAWVVEHPLGAPTEGRVGLSLVGLALAAIALSRRRPAATLFVGILLAGVVLSLGPRLHVLGHDTGLPGPYVLLGNVPLLSISRVPARFAVLAALGLALLAGAGLEVLWARRRRSTRVVTVVVATALAFELVPVPYPSVPVPSLALAERLRQGSGAVLELPYLADDAPRMLYQTVHQRPIFSGYIARRPPKPILAELPLLRSLMLAADEPEILVRRNPLGELAVLDVTSIVVYRPPYYRPDTDDRTPSEAQLRRRVQALLGVTAPTWEDATGAIYAVPPAQPTPAIGPTNGWHAAEANAGGVLRWMGEEASLRLHRPEGRPTTVSFAARSFAKARTVVVSVDGREIGRLAVAEAAAGYTIQVPAGERTAVLVLRSLEPAESPLAVGRGADPRPLTIALSDLSVESG